MDHDLVHVQRAVRDRNRHDALALDRPSRPRQAIQRGVIGHAGSLGLVITHIQPHRLPARVLIQTHHVIIHLKHVEDRLLHPQLLAAPAIPDLQRELGEAPLQRNELSVRDMLQQHRHRQKECYADPELRRGLHAGCSFPPILPKTVPMPSNRMNAAAKTSHPEKSW